MSDSPIIDFDQDYAILNTKVTVGKSYKSRGWALSREDIHDWIPVEKFERTCKIIINDICSDAILRFNPRLFYESDELSLYLKELYDKGCSRHKIPMKIKIPKDNFYYNISNIGEYLNVDHIDTSLRVGKSYSSKGWQLSKDVVVQLFPIWEYDGVYSIFINNIQSDAILNAQFRLFYKSNELSKYLEELYYQNANEKIPAKIIFEYGSNNEKEIKLSDNENLVEKVQDKHGNCICSACGNSYEFNQIFSNEDYFGFCPDCLEKIIALGAYNKIKDSSLSNFVKKEFIEEKFESNFNQVWDLLIKFNFLTPFGDLFKLNGNQDIEKNYSKFLSTNTNNNPNKDSSSKRRNRAKILDLIDEIEEKEDDVCIVCGNVLNKSEIEKCDSCKDKSLACDYLKQIVTDVSYEKHFSKLNLIDLDISRVDVDLIVEKLLKYDLIVEESDIFYKLNNVNYLNDFVKKYADSPYGLQINYVNEDSDVLKISKNDLKSEEKIDSFIRWKLYGDYVSFKKGQYGFVSVQFKQNGAFMYSKGFGTSYEAKVEAINYLKSLGLIMLVDKTEIKLVFK